jgi:hypothetical protein
MKDPVAVLMDQLLAERGGRGRFSATELALAHQLASLLSMPPDATTARTCAAITEMLPARISPDPDPPADLSLLSDRQFAMLEKLLAIARGQQPPTWPRRKQHKQTEREADALRLAGILDAAAAAGRLTADDEIQVRNCLSSMLFPLQTLTGLFPAEIFGPAPPAPLRAAPVSSAEIEPEPIQSEPESPVPDTQNVVQLHRPDPDTAGLKYGAFYTGSDGAGGHFGDNLPGR